MDTSYVLNLTLKHDDDDDVPSPGTLLVMARVKMRFSRSQSRNPGVLYPLLRITRYRKTANFGEIGCIHLAKVLPVCSQSP